MCLMGIDFAREDEIGLGNQFPFTSLGKDECIVHKKKADLLGLKVGQNLNLNFNEPDLWNTLAQEYKKLAQDD